MACVQDVLPYVHIHLARDVGDYRYSLETAVENRTEGACWHAADVCLPESSGPRSMVAIRSLRSADLESTVSMRCTMPSKGHDAQEKKTTCY